MGPHFARQLAAEGRTVFVSSHLMTEMALIADHLIVIGRGRILADCSMQEFMADHARSFVRVQQPAARAPPDVRAGHGLDVGVRRGRTLPVTGTRPRPHRRARRHARPSPARADPGELLPRGRLHGPRPPTPSSTPRAIRPARKSRSSMSTLVHGRRNQPLPRLRRRAAL